MNTFYYSLIKCTADAKRQETVNVGIVVFKGKEFDVRILENSTKLHWFVDENIENSLSDLAERYSFFTSHAETVQEKHEIIRSFRGPVGLGGLGFFTANTNRDYNQCVNRLMLTLVEPPKASRLHHRHQFSTTLREYFASRNLLGEKESDILRHKVVPNYMIDPALDIKAEFMLKNGIYHLTETLDFNVHRGLSEKRKQTAYKLLTFDRADKVFNTLGEDIARYFVYSADRANEANATALLDLMEDNNVRLFNWESAADQKTYTEMMIQLAQSRQDGNEKQPDVH